MGKMLDNVRAWWNSVSDNLGDPGKLAQLSVSDLERSIKKAKEAAAPVVGRPSVLESKLRELQKTDADLTEKIKSLVTSGEEGRIAALKYVERQVTLRTNLDSVQEEYNDAKAASDEWASKIRYLENELSKRRTEANKLEAAFGSAKAEQSLGKQMQNADGILGEDKFSSLKARVEKEQAKAAGYSAMSGLTDKVNDEKLIQKSRTDDLMREYLKDIPGEN